MSYDDRDWDRHRPPSDRPRDDMLMWKVAGGVFIGSLVAAAVIAAVERYRVQVAFEEATRFFQSMTSSAQKSSARATAEMREREARRAAEAEAARERAAEQQRSTEASKRAALEEAARKERAWAKFYKRPPMCDDNPNNQTMVECANGHIRAKRQFEEQYAAGKL
jgi:hypothetical protein